MRFLFTLATVASMAIMNTRTAAVDELMPKITGHMRFLRSGLLAKLLTLPGQKYNAKNETNGTVQSEFPLSLIFLKCDK